MNPNAEKILRSNVVKVKDFHVFNDVAQGRSWTASFELKFGQGFFVRYDKTGYVYKPHLTNNQLPEIEKIYWRWPKEIYIGSRGCGLFTEVYLTNGSEKADKEAYQKILTPAEINEPVWRPYPCFRYLPMLETAFQISRAYEEREKVARKMKMAEQNLADVLALKKATFDLERA